MAFGAAGPSCPPAGGGDGLGGGASRPAGTPVPGGDPHRGPDRPGAGRKGEPPPDGTGQPHQDHDLPDGHGAGRAGGAGGGHRRGPPADGRRLGHRPAGTGEPHHGRDALRRHAPLRQRRGGGGGHPPGGLLLRLYGGDGQKGGRTGTDRYPLRQRPRAARPGPLHHRLRPGPDHPGGAGLPGVPPVRRGPAVPDPRQPVQPQLRLFPPAPGAAPRQQLL